jgi:microcystin-dependent protein
MSAPNGYEAEGFWTTPPATDRVKRGKKGKGKHNKHHRKVRKSPCNRPPSAPTGLVGSFDRVEGARHARIRAKLRWGEVSTDSSGFRLSVRDYIVEVEYTANGSDWFQARRYTVSAKDDGDPGSKDHIFVKNLSKILGYRWRVRANASGKDGCKGIWSAWDVLGNPGEDGPPSPAVVKIDGNGKHHKKIGLRWNAQAAADDDDLFDDRINHFVVELSTSPTFATNYAKDRGVKGNRRTFVIDDAGMGDTYYGRVRSISADRDKSAWIPATSAGNSDPGASPTGIQAGSVDAETGTIRKFGKSATPGGGWLRCNGAGYSTGAYPALFAEIGYTHGGSGGTFNVPDMRRRHGMGDGDSGYTLGQNENDSEPNRNHNHQHASDGTNATPSSDGTGGGGNAGDANTTPGSSDIQEAAHGHYLGSLDTAQPKSGSSATVGGGNVSGQGHQHNLQGWAGAGQSHGHGHGHGGHGHNHGHGTHGHGHGHGQHPHPHPHDNKNRPHLVLRYWIKT